MRNQKAIVRVATLLLALLMSAALFACADNTKDPGKQDPTQPEKPELNASNVLEQYDATVSKDTPFRIWTSNEINSSLTIQQAPTDSVTGDKINDALFQRDAALEEHFGMKIEYTLVQPDANFKLYDEASRVLLTEGDAIDLIFGNMKVYAVNFIQAQLIQPMDQMDGIDLSKPWWNQTAVRDLSVDGTVYFATGDITPRAVFSTFVILFNQKLFTDNSLASPYAAVRNGKWTMEYMVNLIEDTYSDLNDSNTKDLQDFYGFTNEGAAYPFFNGFNGTIIKLSDGKASVVCDDDVALSKMGAIADFFSMEDVFSVNLQTQYDSLDLFRTDMALLSSQTASNLFMLRDMSSDFGVLPLPKYDEEQNQYYSFVNGYCATAVMVPKNVTNKKRVGTLTEAMAALSSFVVTPAAYEQTLLSRQTRDQESIEMLKIAVAGSMYDMNAYFGWGGLYDELVSEMIKGTGNFASAIAGKKDAALLKAEETLDLFR